MCHRPERLLQRHTESLDKTGRSCLCCPQRQVLPEHCAQGELVAVDAAGHSQPRPGAGKTADHLVAAERLGNGQRVGVEVEQAPTACNCRGQVAKIIEAKDATDGTHFRGQLDDPGAVGEGERSPIGIAADVFETGHGAHLEEPQQGGPVEGLPAAQAKLDDSQRPGAGTLRPAPHLARGRGEDVSDRVIELADAMEPGRKGGIGEGHSGRLDQEPGRVGALGTCECDRASANLLGEESPKMAFAEAQSFGEPGDTFAVDGAVCDQAHGARDTVSAPVPIG